jgi:hypothetical protein
MDFGGLLDKSPTEQTDKMTFICMHLENIDTIDEENEEQCHPLLDRADYFDRQKLIDKSRRLYQLR